MLTEKSTICVGKTILYKSYILGTVDFLIPNRKMSIKGKLVPVLHVRALADIFLIHYFE